MPHPDGEASSSGSTGASRGRSLGDLLAWLDRHVNLEAIERGDAGRHAHPDLARIRTLLAAMGDPQQGLPAVHVTGTNGKGSTTRITAALLAAQGLSVGTYTSPHLERLNERIGFGGQPIGDGALADILAALEELEGFLLRRGAAAGGLGEAPTWFELVTAAGYRYLADVAADAAVIEVGLGGRYDATNAVDAAVSVITNVELDHVEILGPTRADIAAEKAGIIKENAIVVVGESDPEIVDIFAAEARRVAAEGLWRRGPDFGCDENRLAHGGRLVDLRTPGATYEGLYLPLHGPHQGLNASVALAAAEAFFGAPLDESVVAEALANVSVPGRLEIVSRRPLVLLDGAHNAAGAEALSVALAEDFASARRIVAVVGCLRGREPQAILAALDPARVGLVVACTPPSPRALPAEAVRAAAEELGLPAVDSGDVLDALARARESVGDDDLLLVTGSLYLVGEARAAFAPGR